MARTRQTDRPTESKTDSTAVNDDGASSPFILAGRLQKTPRSEEGKWLEKHSPRKLLRGGWQHWQVQGATYFIPRQVKSFMNPTKAKGSTGTLTAKEVPPE